MASILLGLASSINSLYFPSYPGMALYVVLAAFLQVESKLALAHNGYMRARFNALVAAKLAIGQLQQLAGPDQRVTMRADLYADDTVAPGPLDATTISNTLNPTAPKEPQKDSQS